MSTAENRPDLRALAAQAAATLSRRAPGFRPRIGIVLGSGLGGLAERFTDAVTVPYALVPGFAATSVQGHAGQVVLGTLDGVPAVALRGRAHMYEGHPAWASAFPVRALHALGIRALFLSNAAGTVNPSYAPGELMAIRDHLNLTGRNPLVGPVVPGDARFPDMTAVWDPELLAVLREAAEESEVRLHEGVYAGLLGPSFETPSEIRMLERLGADAVGMSTVAEAITARALGVPCFGVSCLTNYGAGIGATPLDHAEVMEVTERVADRFQALVLAAVRRADRRLTDGLGD
ncbi:MAG: purine-nucleoside phosphorylase [Gemmatimonadota bacterium]|nr:purine-nucleoside phosphorylase [Gemmatimonadota bacterium]